MSNLTCCNLNTCSVLTPSKCVVYTANLVTDSYLVLDDCDTSLNTVLIQIDTLLKELKDNDGVAKSLLLQYNCDLSHITTLISTTTTKAKTSDVIVALLRTICSLQTRIVSLEDADIFETQLPQEILLLLTTKLSCFDIDPCYPTTLTLKELLIKLINKACP
jgi:hypothetical protein